MGLEQTWRWFGPHDPVSLHEIKQTGATGIVTALHHVPIGEVWRTDEILKRQRLVESAGLTWSVAESIPVHEDIKKRTGQFRTYLENYRQSIRNLGRAGVDIVCYNFMPVLDWSRTDLHVVFRDGSITTRFEARALAAFDIFILRRQHAEKDYSEDRVREAQSFFESVSSETKDQLQRTVLLGLPGSLQTLTLDEFRDAISQYDEISEETFRKHLDEFIKDILPAAEEAGVLMALHPDDPPWSLFGLPRIVGSKEDVARIITSYDSYANGITFCTGSFGASYKNDIVQMASDFAHRISFIHLRNVSRNEAGDFMEEEHLDGDVDMYGVMKALVLEHKRRMDAGRKDFRMPFRPDHGRLMIPDVHREGIYPGYSLFGRMRGLAELRGLERGVRRSLKL